MIASSEKVGLDRRASRGANKRSNHNGPLGDRSLPVLRKS